MEGRTRMRPQREIARGEEWAQVEDAEQSKQGIGHNTSPSARARRCHMIARTKRSCAAGLHALLPQPCSGPALHAFWPLSRRCSHALCHR